MLPGHRPIVAVVGGSVCSTEVFELAELVGRELAALGARVVCGGLGGVLKAVSKGAHQAGGQVIGILPGSDRSEANRYVDTVIPTGLGEARNAVIIKTAEAVIALPGEFGTLSEIAFALRSGKPVFSLGDWKISDKIVTLTDPQEAARRAVQAARSRYE